MNGAVLPLNSSIPKNNAQQTNLFELLPGIEIPLSDISSTLANLWKGEMEDKNTKNNIFHACQMNLILHFGETINTETALTNFWNAIHFSQIRPSRIIVLCPLENTAPTPSKAKLFAQCFIGASLDERCCCEAIIFNYQAKQIHILDHQIANWIDCDLPVNYWPQRLSIQYIMDSCLKFTTQCRNIIYEASTENAHFPDIPWPKNVILKDITAANILPIKQTLGALLSTYSPETITQDLQSIDISSSPELTHLATSIQAWQRKCILTSLTNSSQIILFTEETHNTASNKAAIIQCKWTYSNTKSFTWLYNKTENILKLSIQLDKHLHSYTNKLTTYPIERILSELLS